jgi:hypothetical protein
MLLVLANILCKPAIALLLLANEASPFCSSYLAGPNVLPSLPCLLRLLAAAYFRWCFMNLWFRMYVFSCLSSRIPRSYNMRQCSSTSNQDFVLLIQRLRQLPSTPNVVKGRGGLRELRAPSICTHTHIYPTGRRICSRAYRPRIVCCVGVSARNG